MPSSTLATNRTAGADRPAAVGTEAVALAAELLGIAPRRASRRVILTTSGLAVIQVVDRFTEIAVELHWSVIADVLAGLAPDGLAEFRGFQLDGHELAHSADQIPSKKSGEVG
jgi:hypothetical protein